MEMQDWVAIKIYRPVVSLRIKDYGMPIIPVPPFPHLYNIYLNIIRPLRLSAYFRLPSTLSAIFFWIQHFIMTLVSSIVYGHSLKSYWKECSMLPYTPVLAQLLVLYNINGLLPPFISGTATIRNFQPALRLSRLNIKNAYKNFNIPFWRREDGKRVCWWRGGVTVFAAKAGCCMIDCTPSSIFGRYMWSRDFLKMFK